MRSFEHQSQRAHVFIVSRIGGELFFVAGSCATNSNAAIMTVQLAAKRATTRLAQLSKRFGLLPATAIVAP
jgi:hypothetical protein